MEKLIPRERLVERLAALFPPRGEVLDACLFGSCARGQAQTHSDIDIDILMDAETLPPEFGAQFREVAGFRNILVHGYLEVDLDIVSRVLLEHLDDFEKFAVYVEEWLSR